MLRYCLIGSLSAEALCSFVFLAGVRFLEASCFVSAAYVLPGLWEALLLLGMACLFLACLLLFFCWPALGLVELRLASVLQLSVPLFCFIHIYSLKKKKESTMIICSFHFTKLVTVMIQNSK